MAGVASTGTAFESSAINGSEAGLTWAGATEDAVKAAITMKVERSGTNMQTVTKAVNRPVGVLPWTAIAEGGSPTAWHLSPAYMPICGCPPRLYCGP